MDCAGGCQLRELKRQFRLRAQLQQEVGDVLYKRVLLLEDNKMNQRVATELLESAGVSSRWPTMVGW